MIIGGPGWSRETSQSMANFAERWHLPTVAAFRYQDYIDNRHPCYIGHAGLGMEPHVAAAIRAADLLLVVGPRLGEITTAGYTLIDPPNPRQGLIHIHPDPDELGSVYAPEISVAATSESFARELAALTPATRPMWADGLPSLRESWEASLAPRAMPGAINLGAIIRHLSDALPDDAIVSNGAGNYAAFLHKHFIYKGYRTQLAPTSGSMGYGLPAAIAAKLHNPDKTVVCLAGDGCLMMTVQELATAVQYELAIVVLVANNATFGTIRMHQEKNYPFRVSATDLRNPDFPALARSFGAHGERVDRMDDFMPALRRALEFKGPALIELKIDTDAISPRQTITELRGSASR
jgi:acetolactate synthase-1/2/3 large subunit